MSKLLDANAILRYLLNDIPEQADITEHAVLDGAYTIPEVLAEVVYVLDGVYQLGRSEVADTLRILLAEIDISDKPVILSALDEYRSTGLDYVDCILIARSIVLKEDILSFDKKLNRRIAGQSRKK